ncbi:TadE/TadG family type IV pilus assembly protein [Roseibium aestuarii]|uniref:TadE/TadG family type IV pilus assembly protein n=1 Tax=Roseibium aestuarii TaxID=2600299 RepID=A0ABW4JVJ1_9HYPH|nr:TadE/TadG family type IV pilus assembly protein [Roseibium aestuarii]
MVSAAARILRSFARGSAGVAAVEFALVLPFLMLLLVGMAEFTTALNQKQKVSQTARSVADLIAQAEIVTDNDIEDVVYAAEQIMQPYTDGTLNVIIASVTFDGDGNPAVDWSRERDGSAPWPAGAAPPLDIPDEIRFPNTSLVIGYAVSTYTPAYAGLTDYLMPYLSAVNLTDVYFLRPRLTSTVVLQ